MLATSLSFYHFLLSITKLLTKVGWFQFHLLKANTVQQSHIERSNIWSYFIRHRGVHWKEHKANRTRIVNRWPYWCTPIEIENIYTHTYMYVYIWTRQTADLVKLCYNDDLILLWLLPWCSPGCALYHKASLRTCNHVHWISIKRSNTSIMCICLYINKDTYDKWETDNALLFLV